MEKFGLKFNNHPIIKNNKPKTIPIPIENEIKIIEEESNKESPLIIEEFIETKPLTSPKKMTKSKK